jgi:L-ribulose-5-phosphate 3-epimerase
MKIGIRNGSMGNPETPQLFSQVAEIGFDGVELDVPRDYADCYLFQDEGKAMLSQLSLDTGVDIPSLCIGALWEYSPAAADQQRLSAARYLLESTIETAADLGARWILVPVTPSEEEIEHAEGTSRWVAEMSRVARNAESADVILALENVGRGYGKSAGELKHMCEQVGSSHLKVYYDIGNATAFENDPIEEIEILGNLIAEVHVKDYEGTLLGEGIVDIPGSLAALREIGYDDWLVLETPPTDDPMAAGRHNLEYLEGLRAS